MNIPPPPPQNERFVQFLTPAADKAVRTRSGQVYETLVSVLRQLNPGCFDSDKEVGDYLSHYIWPPITADAICEPFPHIPIFPTKIQVANRPVDVLISDLAQWAEVSSHRGALKTSFTQVYDGPEGMAQSRREWIAEGYSSDSFDKMITGGFAKAAKSLKKPWWKFW